MAKTILLVEDDQDILDIIYYLLTDEGYEVVRSKGAGVLEEVIKYKPDLVLLDHRLQIAWGADICQALKADPTTRQIPVVMMSATMGLEETARNAGADDILAKPFDIADILKLVATYLGTAEHKSISR
ncbi:two-component system, OmpR family, phosphate regulon response regulator PhoB [Mucilaginibacter gossypiicola]|uniref:Two-component system, OmpR family, phosphate regulon response regulator PhoB n=1 Tax=Mucilaginibacter gossypiicola TaxID=551995 RepID=A0A1H8D7F2_9SPHI|nr:response regulator [Mucilaginibacter gossypiicola]SEN03179.1 two-component system, OmpR family, phosphate regulon response regulator PhoB [Mucilaginibacter gossypiicola]